MGLKGKLPDFVSIIFNLKENLKKKKKISFSDSFEQIIIDYYMAFFILPLLSARDLDIGHYGFSPMDDISRGLMTRTI